MIQKSTSPRLGLALSGGGFRAVLYHLGVIRFLRDAGLLSQVAQITSVSGGSVLGAHLALNWDRYTGTEQEFEAAADQLLRFVRLDVRNRIVRRFPLASLLNTARRVTRLEPKRQYTRAGLLERHYEKHLYGDTALFELPDSPRLYILATNLSEGSLCAFHRDGLLLQRRRPGEKTLYYQDVDVGLATVPMAVAASSAFPGFFPPLELRSSDVGACDGEFGRQAFTDGGIYDNLGLRMFHHLQSHSLHQNRERRLEILDAASLQETLATAEHFPEGSTLRTLSHRLHMNGSSRASSSSVATIESAERLEEKFYQMAQREELYRLPAFQSLRLRSQYAQRRLQEAVASSDRPCREERIWLNYELAAAVIEQTAGKACLKIQSNRLDGILVSDAGASFKVLSDGRAGGLLSTAIRSTDILMDRVNQLEQEAFDGSAGNYFLHISRIVSRTEDPTAPHPEIQRQSAQIRTDMDRFSDIEIAALIQHGYCVARQSYHERNSAQVRATSEGNPWNPVACATRPESQDFTKATSPPNDNEALRLARTLQRSSSRRTISRLFSWRDWPTFVWTPLLALLVLSVPYMLISAHRTAIHQGHVLAVVAQTSPVYRQVLELLDSGHDTTIHPITFDEVETIEPLDFTGYDVISDDRIYDLRGWTSRDRQGEWAPRMHAQIRVRRTEQAAKRPTLRIQLPSVGNQMAVQYFPTSLQPVHRRAKNDSGLYVYETELDFRHVPIGTDTNLRVNQILPTNIATQTPESGRFQFSIAANTGLVRIWVLLPDGREHDQFELVGFPMEDPDLVEVIDATTTVELPVGAIATFQMVNPKNNYRYECRWRWTDTASSQ